MVDFKPKATSTIQFTPKSKGDILPKPKQGIDKRASNIPVASQVQDFGLGLGSAIGRGGLGLGQAALRAGMGITSGISKLTGGLLKTDNSLAQSAVDVLEKGKQALYTKPIERNLETMSGQAGNIVGNLAPYFSGGAPAQATKLAFSTLAPRAVSALPYAAQDAAIASGQSGGDVKTTLGAGATSLVANTLLPGSGSPIAQKVFTGMGTGYVGDVASGLAGQRGEDREGLSALIPGFGTALGTGIGVATAIPQIRQALRIRGEQNTYNKRVQELTHLQQKNSRVNKTFEAADRKGINIKHAIADSDLLVGAVTKEGAIDTRSPGMAVDKLDDMLAPYEGKVGEALRAENKRVPVASVQEYLYKTIDDAGLLGDVRTSARNRVDAMINGLSNVVDAEGNMPLATVHDLKIQTNQLNAKSFQNPEANAVGKNIGRGLKEFVEQNTKAIDAKGYNEDLARFYALRKALYDIHGTTVRGGRLGKYFAQTIGAIAGNAIGGPLGAIAGAEAGNVVRSASLQRTFGGTQGNPVIPTARMQQTAEAVNQSSNLGNRQIIQANTITPTKNVIPPPLPQLPKNASSVIPKKK